MKKIFSFLTLLLLTCSMAWADYTVLFDGYSSTTKTDYYKDYSVNGETVSVTSSQGISSSSGDYYLQIGSAASDASTNYVSVVATEEIEYIAFLLTGNGNNKTLIPALLCWNTAYDSNNKTKVDSAIVHSGQTIAQKGYANAEWLSFDLSQSHFKEVRLYKQAKNIVVKSASAANFPASDAQTLQVYGVKIQLRAAKPTITTQPVGASYATGDPISALTVAATASGGTLTYQWYSCTSALKANAAAIDGATSASYTPTAAGFYYVTVTNANGSVDSDVVEIVISAATAPTINVTGTPAEPIIVGTEVTLSAEMTGVPSPTIQWYSCDDAQKTNSEAIDGATEDTYAPSTAAAGTFYFYAVATNSQGNAASSVQTIVVKEKVATPTFTPNGAYFEGTQSVTIACATDGAAIVYSIDNGVNWSPYSTALSLSATTTVKAKATKANCFDSEIATATFTLFAKSELVAISAAKTWTIPTTPTLELKDDGTTTPAKYDEYYTYADIATINSNNLGEFDGTTLAFSGQYPYRGSNGAQNGNLQFITTVPGKVTVEFSNTGGSNKDRWVKVNNTIGSVEADGTTKRTETFNVAAGTVTITHVDTVGNLSKGLRMYSIVFTPAESITLGENGYSTYAANKKYTVSGAEVYKAKYTGSNVVIITKVADAVVPANEGIILKGVEGEKAYFLESSENASDFSDNDLVGVLTSTAAEATWYVLATDLDGDGLTKFHKCGSVTIPANKAYLEITGNNAPSIRIIEAENNATDIKSIEDSEKAVKFIENGKLYIQKDGVVYDATGAKVK